MLSLPAAFLLSLAAAPAAAPGCAQESAAAKDFEAVRKQVERRQWDKAYDGLRALLAKYEGDEWLLAEADAIRVDMKRIVFWRTHAEPDPATLVSGTLKKYKDGKLEIVYESGGWDDWELQGEELFVWPARFAGPYTLDISLGSYPNRVPFSLVLAATEETALRISFGLKNPMPEVGQPADYFYPARIEALVEGREEELDSNKNVLPLGAHSVELKVQVTTSKVTVSLDGKKYLEAKRPKGGYGSFGLFTFRRQDEAQSLRCSITGEIEPMWMQNKADAALEGARAEFETAYAESEHLPAWLLAPAGAAAPRAVDDGPPQRPYPGPGLDDDGYDAYRVAMDHLRYLGEEEGLDAQLGYVEELRAEGELGPAVLEFLRLRAFKESGRFADAIAAAERVIAADPAHLETRLMRARMLARLGRRAESDAAWDEALAAFPGSMDAVVERVADLIERNDIARAHRVVRAVAFASAESAARLEWLRSVLLMADKGPAFERSYEHASEHYVVRSDISREICAETARLLESAYTSYSVHLKRPPGAESGKFRVYLFSGEASYMRYADEAFGGRMENSAGVYSRLVKQLLIWNLPDADERRRTVVHEGFHQYLDAITQDAPRWFNEGLAQYYELADTVAGRFTTGQVDAHALRTLEQEGVLPLADYFRINDEAFLDPAAVGRNYAQGWALVHFLRHGGRAYEAVFDALFRGLTEGLSAGAAVRAAFADADLDALEAAFVEYLSGLEQG